MCGIVGLAYFEPGRSPDARLLKKMCDTIVHRGPDEEGIDVKGNVGFGMRRLSIIDIVGGKQPIFNETRTVRTVFNGEIYNYRELRALLEKKGHVFKSESDTEVIVHAYEEYGIDFASHLNGMFGLAVHDMEAKRLLLVRDHIGIKPLFYYLDRQKLVWGSEIKALLASDEVPRELNIAGLGDFLAWEYVPGEGTLFQGIKKLLPGSLLDIDLRSPAKASLVTYWDVPAECEDQSVDGAVWQDQVDEALRASVKRQLVSDVPLGAFLSGGVDSSLISAMAGDIQTFSIGFDDPSYSELKWSKRVAEHLNVRHVTEVITPNISESFDYFMNFMDDPIGDFSIFPTYLVSRLARKYVTVSLSGDGGDELFAGYESYLADEMAVKYGKLPSFLRNGLISPVVNSLKPRPEKKGLVNKAKRFVEGVAEPAGLAHARWRIFAGDRWRKSLFSADVLPHLNASSSHHIDALFSRAGNRERLNRSLYVDLKSYLVDNILVKVDRMSMAVSLEARVPYLDKDLVELAFRIPARFKLEAGETKSILKKIAVRYVPKECVYRPKEGFSIPIKNWLRGELRPLMEDLLSSHEISSQKLFNYAEIERLKNEHIQGDANHSHILWSLMVFQAWRRRWLEK